LRAAVQLRATRHTAVLAPAFEVLVCALLQCRVFADAVLRFLSAAAATMAHGGFYRDPRLSPRGHPPKGAPAGHSAHVCTAVRRSVVLWRSAGSLAVGGVDFAARVPLAVAQRELVKAVDKLFRRFFFGGGVALYVTEHDANWGSRGRALSRRFCAPRFSGFSQPETAVFERFLENFAIFYFIKKSPLCLACRASRII